MGCRQSSVLKEATENPVTVEKVNDKSDDDKLKSINSINSELDPEKINILVPTSSTEDTATIAPSESTESNLINLIAVIIPLFSLIFKAPSAAYDKACFGAGCYWGTEKYFKNEFAEKKTVPGEYKKYF